jgi:hypothetical protein
MQSASAPALTPLLADVRLLINGARQRVASVVNAELTQLYWHIGRRISTELLQGERAEYGKHVVAELARQLTVDFGKGWSEQQLRHCMRLSEIFVDEQILSTVRRELSWSHLKTLIYIEAPLKRDFYLEICRLEHWSVRQLQERINSLLFERTAISKKPEETIRQDLKQLREQGQLSPDLTFRDPYVLDFLGLSDSYSEKDLEAAYKGQMELYLRFLEKHEQIEGEATPIGLILCTGKSVEHVELMQLDQSNIRVADYLTLLPPRETLQAKLHLSIELVRQKLLNDGHGGQREVVE